MASQNYKAWSVVTASTSAFTVCFMVWMMFAVIGIPIKQALNLNETQFGILVALPVLTGSLIRLPLGMWTDRYGGGAGSFFFIPLASPGGPYRPHPNGPQILAFPGDGSFGGGGGGVFPGGHQMGRASC